MSTDAERVAERARQIFTDWGDHGDPRDRRAMAGWRTMSVEELHGVCDPNAAFDSAATDCGQDDSDWAAWVTLLDAAMSVYDTRYATR